METIRLKTEIDTMLRTGTMNKETTPAFLFVGGENIKASALSTDTELGDDLKKKILMGNTRILPSLSHIKNGGKDKEVSEIQDMGNTLVTGIQENLTSFVRDTKRNDSIHTLAYANSMEKLLAINTSVPSSSPSTSTPSSSQSTTSSTTAASYQYEGIYILDKNNKQVRLFNYIDTVDGKEELIYSDVDKDGDDDIIYRMNNSLYLKRNFSNDVPTSHSSDSPKVLSPQDFLYTVTDNGSSRILSAPNHFEETFITSGEIDFSFRPASPFRDNLFRFEYYDYVDRFDKINSGESPLSIDPKTMIHKVDLIPEISSETVLDTAHTGFV